MLFIERGDEVDHEVLAGQVRGPRFQIPSTHVRVMDGSMHLQPQSWEAETGRAINLTGGQSSGNGEL